MPVASQGTEVGQDGFGRTKVTSFSREVEIFEGGLLPLPPLFMGLVARDFNNWWNILIGHDIALILSP